MEHTNNQDNGSTPDSDNQDARRSPHDEFFTYVFTDRENVRDFLCTSLPEPVLRLIELESLRISKETFVDEELKWSQSDILIETSLRTQTGPALIYVLIEHKSYPDRWTMLQLLKYMVKIWENKKKEHFKVLPVIIPMIFYHGKARWRHPLQFASYFYVPADLKSHIPDFAAFLIEPGYIDIFRTGGNYLYQAAMLVFKYSFRMLEKHVPEIMSTAAASSQDSRFEDFLTALLRYILLVLKGGYEEEVRKAVKAINMREVEEAYMTIADKLRKEGKIQDKQQVLIRQLSKKYSLTEQEREHISSITDPDKLDRALDEIVVAETKEQVLKLLE